MPLLFLGEFLHVHVVNIAATEVHSVGVVL